MRLSPHGYGFSDNARTQQQTMIIAHIRLGRRGSLVRIQSPRPLFSTYAARISTTAVFASSCHNLTTTQSLLGRAAHFFHFLILTAQTPDYNASPSLSPGGYMAPLVCEAYPCQKKLAGHAMKGCPCGRSFGCCSL